MVNVSRSLLISPYIFGLLLNWAWRWDAKICWLWSIIDQECYLIKDRGHISQFGNPEPHFVDMWCLLQLIGYLSLKMYSYGVQLLLYYSHGFETYISCAEYTSENPKIMTKCSHHFHLGCIYEWMERSDSCPVCGKVIFSLMYICLLHTHIHICMYVYLYISYIVRHI